VVVVGHGDDARLRVQHQRRVLVAQNGGVPDAAEQAGVRVLGLDGYHADAGCRVLRQLGRVRRASEPRSVVVDVVQVDRHRRPGCRSSPDRVVAAAGGGRGQLGGHHLSARRTQSVIITHGWSGHVTGGVIDGDGVEIGREDFGEVSGVVSKFSVVGGEGWRKQRR